MRVTLTIDLDTDMIDPEYLRQCADGDTYAGFKRSLTDLGTDLAKEAIEEAQVQVTWDPAWAGEQYRLHA
jgi:hypothetical protein